jgi:hypothetical protein
MACGSPWASRKAYGGVGTRGLGAVGMAVGRPGPAAAGVHVRGTSGDVALFVLVGVEPYTDSLPASIQRDDRGPGNPEKAARRELGRFRVQKGLGRGSRITTAVSDDRRAA